MENLFYSRKDRMLFLIVEGIENRDKTHKITRILKTKKSPLVESILSLGRKIKARNIIKSRWFCGMIFYVETDNIPEKAFVVSDNYTMMEFVQS